MTRTSRILSILAIVISVGALAGSVYTEIHFEGPLYQRYFGETNE